MDRLPRFRAIVAVAGLVLAVALAAAHAMETHGHVVTGMNNQVVWGLPHVFAFFLIVAASGALNVASVASVFGVAEYKPHAPLSVLVAMALLAGGLFVLVLDLGRPERLLVAATTYNFSSIFAWNMVLYTGFLAIGTAYLWVMLERRLRRHAAAVGLAAFAWRLVLTTGTGSILGFLVARPAYSSAIVAPLFIALSLAWGLAAFCLLQSLLGIRLDEAFARRIGRLLGVFVLASLWLAAVYHLTNLYWARQDAFERFILRDGSPYAFLFWGGFVAAGCLAPLALVFNPRIAGPRATLAACGLVMLGAFAFLYAFVIGGQAFPLDTFPGYVARSSFGDGAVDPYLPSLPEALLGFGGLALATLLASIGTRALPVLPDD